MTPYVGYQLGPKPLRTNTLDQIPRVNTLDLIPWTNTMDQNTMDQILWTKNLVFQGICAFPFVKVCVYIYATCIHGLANGEPPYTSLSSFCED